MKKTWLGLVLCLGFLAALIAQAKETKAARAKAVPSSYATRSIYRENQARKHALASTGLGRQQTQTALQSNMPLVAEASVSGALSYFSGRSNRRGQALPQDALRFLAGEQLTVRLALNQPVDSIEISFAGSLWRFRGLSGLCSYEIPLTVPEGLETRAWAGERLSGPLTLFVTVKAGDQEALATVSGIDITGCLSDCIHAQPVSWPAG